jgi:protein-tyrosine-phosphatase
MAPELESSLAEARGVLFLCSGNMVRSAFAELYARHLSCPLPVASAATLFRNDHLLPETARALLTRGVALAWARAFRPRHVDDLLPELDERTLVLVMARMHLAPLARRPALLRNAYLLSSVLGEGSEIDDPVMEGADFELTFQRVAHCVEVLVQRLRERPPGAGS